MNLIRSALLPLAAATACLNPGTRKPADRPDAPAEPTAVATAAQPDSLPWPRTVAEAAAQSLGRMLASERESLRRLRRDEVPGLLHGYQMVARYQFGLQHGNLALLRSCGSETIVLEDCLLIILDAAWLSLQRPDTTAAR